MNSYTIRRVEMPVKVKEIWYVAHPVSGDPIANCFKVVQWIKWFTENDPSRIYIAPWVPEVLAFPNTSGPSDPVYERALANDEMIVMKLDGIVAVGGRMSVGMKREWDCAMANGKWCTDLTQYNTPNDLPEGFFMDPASED